MGKRLLRKWLAQPLSEMFPLKVRSDAVQEVFEKQSSSASLHKALGLLQGTPDLEKGLARLSYNRSSPSEMATILLALNRITTEFNFESRDKVPLTSSMLKDAIFALSDARQVAFEALSSISTHAAKEDDKANLFVDSERFPKVQDVKDLLSINKQDFTDHLKELRKELKRPSLQYAKVADKEYLIEVRKEDAKKVPSNWLRISE